jgi:hypothetical protein
LSFLSPSTPVLRLAVSAAASLGNNLPSCTDADGGLHGRALGGLLGGAIPVKGAGAGDAGGQGQGQGECGSRGLLNIISGRLGVSWLVVALPRPS